jgi:hypothetical protein
MIHAHSKKVRHRLRPTCAGATRSRKNKSRGTRRTITVRFPLLSRAREIRSEFRRRFPVALRTCPPLGGGGMRHHCVPLERDQEAVASHSNFRFSFRDPAHPQQQQRPPDFRVAGGRRARVPRHRRAPPPTPFLIPRIQVSVTSHFQNGFVSFPDPFLSARQHSSGRRPAGPPWRRRRRLVPSRALLPRPPHVRRLRVPGSILQKTLFAPRFTCGGTLPVCLYFRAWSSRVWKR